MHNLGQPRHRQIIVGTGLALPERAPALRLRSHMLATRTRAPCRNVDTSAKVPTGEASAWMFGGGVERRGSHAAIVTAADEGEQRLSPRAAKSLRAPCDVRRTMWIVNRFADLANVASPTPHREMVQSVICFPATHAIRVACRLARPV
jgi:hypothetical protein